MLLGILGDLHLTNKSPERRLDNYWDTLCNKLIQALKIFNDRKCGVVLQVGDFFNAPTVADKVMSEIIQILYSLGMVDKKKTLCCFGQHDISGHSKWTLSNSPLAVLQAARVVKMLGDEPVILKSDDKDGIDLHFYGASFGESIPKPYEDSYNVLVTHRMIGDRPLWPGQELVGPRQFLKKHPDFNLICCGDYHYRFIDTWNGRTIINPGAIVRKTIGKFDLEHKPAVVIFDTEKGSSEVVELDVKPVEKIFDFTKNVVSRDSKVLADLVKQLKEGGRKVSGWKHILVKVLKKRKSNQKVKDAIDIVLEEVKSEGVR